MIVKTAEFSLSSPMVSMCPQDTKPEYAFIGRSNVGKSSLINMLTQRVVSCRPAWLWFCQAFEKGGAENRPDDSWLYFGT